MDSRPEWSPGGVLIPASTREVADAGSTGMGARVRNGWRLPWAPHCLVGAVSAGEDEEVQR